MTAPTRLSAFTIMMQQTSPSFSQATTAILSLGFKLAFSRKSLGSTIWPFASIVMTALILQVSPSQVFLSQLFVFNHRGSGVVLCS